MPGAVSAIVPAGRASRVTRGERFGQWIGAGMHRPGVWWPPVRLGLALVGLLFALAIAWARTRDGFAWDARAYWLADLDNLYSTALVTPDFAYLYSPAFAQALTPLRALPWEVFLPLWTALQAVALVALAGPFTLLALLTEPVLYELDVANVTLLIGVAIVAGFRWPAAWAFVLLTKVTPGVGVLWFAFRREWRALGIALGATAAIAAVSFALAPGQWFAWLSALVVHDPALGFGPPLWARLPAAVAVLWWGARSDRRWVVPLVVLLAMPVLRTPGLALLLAMIPLAAYGVPRRSIPQIGR